MIKILQLATVVMFVLIVVLGVIIVFATPEKIGAYAQLVGIIWPIFLMEVIPALIGKPLTEYMRARAAAITPTPAPTAAPTSSPAG